MITVKFYSIITGINFPSPLIRKSTVYPCNHSCAGFNTVTFAIHFRHFFPLHVWEKGERDEEARREKSIWSGFSVSSGSLLKIKVTNGCSCSGSWLCSSQLFQNKQRRQPSQSLHSAPNSPFNYFAICPLSTFYQWDVYGADRLNPTHVKHG